MTRRNRSSSRLGISSLYIALFLTLALLPLVEGCSKSPVEHSSSPTNSNPESNAQSKQPQAGKAEALDSGDFKLRYQERKSFRGHNVSKVGSNQQALERAVNDLNNKVSIPFDIYISLEDCDAPDSYYETETHQVTICYQLIDEYYSIFSGLIKDQTKLDEAVRGATVSTFYHELGHALVDAWKIPITGKEEDAVDQLSTLVLIDRTEEGERMALDGARSFRLYADLEKTEKKIYWDEHSLDEQRFYDTICLIYGHNPEKYEYLVKDGTLPQERAEICPDDYARTQNSWKKLLGPYLKESPQTSSK